MEWLFWLRRTCVGGPVARHILALAPRQGNTLAFGARAKICRTTEPPTHGLGGNPGLRPGLLPFSVMCPNVVNEA